MHPFPLAVIVILSAVYATSLPDDLTNTYSDFRVGWRPVEIDAIANADGSQAFDQQPASYAPSSSSSQFDSNLLLKDTVNPPAGPNNQLTPKNPAKSDIALGSQPPPDQNNNPAASMAQQASQNPSNPNDPSKSISSSPALPSPDSTVDPSLLWDTYQNGLSDQSEKANSIDLVTLEPIDSTECPATPLAPPSKFRARGDGASCAVRTRKTICPQDIYTLCCEEPGDFFILWWPKRCQKCEPPSFWKHSAGQK